LIGEDGFEYKENSKSSFLITGKTWVNNHAHVLKTNDKILDKYLVEIINKIDLTPYMTGISVPKLNQSNLNNIKIPLPPMDVQEKIVAEIEKFEEEETNIGKRISSLKQGVNVPFGDIKSLAFRRREVILTSC
jgi:type I restriction enzyme S subunit